MIIDQLELMYKWHLTSRRNTKWHNRQASDCVLSLSSRCSPFREQESFMLFEQQLTLCYTLCKRCCNLRSPRLTISVTYNNTKHTSLTAKSLSSIRPTSRVGQYSIVDINVFEANWKEKRQKTTTTTTTTTNSNPRQKKNWETWSTLPTEEDIIVLLKRLARYSRNHKSILV